MILDIVFLRSWRPQHEASPACLWSVNPRFQINLVTHHIYFRIFYPSMAYLSPTWMLLDERWSFCVQNLSKTSWDKVFTLTAVNVRQLAHCKTVSNSVCFFPLKSKPVLAIIMSMSWLEQLCAIQHTVQIIMCSWALGIICVCWFIGINH